MADLKSLLPGTCELQSSDHAAKCGDERKTPEINRCEKTARQDLDRIKQNQKAPIKQAGAAERISNLTVTSVIASSS